MTEVRRPRGRPRPDETIARDQEILNVLRDHGPQSRNSLADLIGMDEDRTKVYLSLRRLREQGMVRICAPCEKGSDLVWMAVEEDKPCP